MEKTLIFNNETIYLHTNQDWISNKIIQYKCWEPIISGLFVYLLKNTDKSVVIDVGCNIGYFSIIASKYCDVVYSIDAYKPNLDLLGKTIKKNKMTNIISTHYAVSDTDNAVYKPVKILDVNIGATKFTKTDDSSFTTKSITLDTFVCSNNITQIELIKIDIEGGELNCLNGMKQILKNKIVKNFIIELTPLFNNDSEDIINLLKDDYNIFDVGCKECGFYNYDKVYYDALLTKPIIDVKQFVKKIKVQTNVLCRIKYND